MGVKVRSSFAALAVIGVLMAVAGACSSDRAGVRAEQETPSPASSVDGDVSADGPDTRGDESASPVAGAPDASPPPVLAADRSIVQVASVRNDTSLPLRSQAVIPPGNSDAGAPGKVGEEGKDGESGDEGEAERELEDRPPLRLHGHVDAADRVTQADLVTPGAPKPLIPAVNKVIDGISAAQSLCNCAPPDTNGDVGTTQYLQTVNKAFAVYSKATGAVLYGPAAIKTIWQGFGGACQDRNDGDPVALYDTQADRWLISQFTTVSPYHECIAISATGDATGAWYRYAFPISTSGFPDYPKFGVWPDGYYMSVNWFVNGIQYAGPRPFAFDRAKMLAGLPASFQTTTAPLGSAVNPIQPADLDGTTQPPAGTPGLFAGIGTPIKIYKFKLDWANPAASSWTTSQPVAIGGFTSLCPDTRSCIAQKGTSQRLDGIGDRLMNRVVYRNMGSYRSLLATFAVDVGGRAAMRWLEIRNPANSPVLYQQGTFAPVDGLSRWMGSIAMDAKGNIALGYSASSTTAYPSIRYTAREATAALGTMNLGEGVIAQGTGAQVGTSRWGDYSNLSIDPVDGCTFWYTNQLNNSGGWGWTTKIGTFRLYSCTTP